MPTSFDPEKTQEILARFYRDGFAHIPGVLTADETKALRHTADRLLDDQALRARENPELHDKRYVQMHVETSDGTDQETPFILRNTVELDPLFVELLERQPILGLAEAALGPDCRFCGQNVLRNEPRVAIESWHVDGAVHFPLPEGVARHDPLLRPPVLWLTVQIALSDVETIEHGPTQYVPGSHFSGRGPDSQDNPIFEEQRPVSVLCKAGDIYLHDPQCWHRGAPNTSDRRRYLMQSQYAVDWAFRRFGWMNRVPVPDATLHGSSDRVLRLLGRSRPHKHDRTIPDR
jgi:hypothetical protein